MTKANIIVKGDTVFDGISDKPFKGYVAIKKDVIIHVGHDYDGIEEYIDTDTKIIENQRGLIMPGFHDSHFHLAHGVNEINSVDLSLATSEEDAVWRAVEHSKNLPDDGTPIYGYYWYHGNWDEPKLPTKKLLDKHFPGRPVILYRVESHGVWLNSKALEMFHIDKDTPDPENGEIVKDTNGEPTGYLHELAIFLMGKYSITPYEKEKEKYIAFFEYLNSYGITSISDLQYDMPTNYGIFSQLEEENKLNIRYGFATLLSEDLSKPEEYRKKYDSEKVKYLGLKDYIDGTILGYTSELCEPYEDKPDTTNDMPFDFEKIKQNAIAADAKGFRVRLHAIGDGAVRIAFDIFNTCIEKNGKRDSRHSIAHMESIQNDDITKFGELGVIAEIHPAHVTLPCESAKDNPYPKHLGNRADNCFMYKSVLETGGRIAIGSDFPVVTPNPMLGIYRGYTRRFNDGLPLDGWIPEEKLSMVDLLKGYTSGTAYHDFKEKISGTLEKGKRADMVVLDTNLFELKSPEDILDTKVETTIFDGRIVYEKEKRR